MSQPEQSQFSPSELDEIQEILQTTKVMMFVYTALIVMMVPNLVYSMRMLLLRKSRGAFTPVPWLCFLQASCVFILLLFSIIGYFAPFEDCTTQGRLIEPWLAMALCFLHSLLFVKSYYALNKVKWLLFTHIALELGFIGSFVVAAWRETFTREETTNNCLSILTESTLLAELAFDVTINVLYSAIFIYILRNQQLHSNQAQWKALQQDGLIYMIGITITTTLLVITTLILGITNIGVVLLVLSVVIGSCLMTYQLWNAKRSSDASNSSFESNSLIEHTRSPKCPAQRARNPLNATQKPENHLKEPELSLRDSSQNPNADFHLVSINYPESILIAGKS
ncbi:hypothetical protein K7432_012166 [Basidiobolus ranarum]|uniref:Uncharacterized protein n=1 Tax=Basidiobolus ranarum TaxID=34480 RepID=A0ABR2WLB8_9FUNG